MTARWPELQEGPERRSRLLRSHGVEWMGLGAKPKVRPSSGLEQLGGC